MQYLFERIRHVAICCFYVSLFNLAMGSGVDLCEAAGKSSKNGMPNVVVILTDNHGAWTLGCYGNKDIQSPNIDRMAHEGALFTQAFASNPVCSPTRATLITGLMPSQHGVHSFLAGGNLQTGPNARNTLDRFTSLPEILKEKGYTCGLVGKWHLGGNLKPQESLDDYWITMPHGGTSTFYDAQIIENGKIRKEPEYLTDFWTRHAVKFIGQNANGKKPFFLFLAYNGPYSLGRLLLREGRNRHVAFYADKEIPSFPRQRPHAWQFNNLDYINNPISIRRVAAEVSGVDDGVGEVMSALGKAGVDENTIVIFLADQGWAGGHGGFFGMGDHTRPLTARDEMMRIPMIWRHPSKIISGQQYKQLISNYDVLPTLLGHLGLSNLLPKEPNLPGNDFSDLLAGKSHTKNAKEDGVFYEYENLRCIRTRTHKYVHRYPNGPNELYDLTDDPEEFNNLASVAEVAPIREQLKNRIDNFFDQYATPEFDMWNGGTSQVRIHDGIDEELAQLASVDAPTLSDGFTPAPIQIPEGYTVELAAGPPLVSHPTMGCFDDAGNLYVCNNAGVNMSNQELEQHLPNAIHRLVDQDRDGRFDSSTVFADKMTFPMGGAWHDGSLFVASPPHIWKLTDTNDDGFADTRETIVSGFGYTGNAASIHGCFFGDDGRLYWTDGYHGHEFTDEKGNSASKREGSYLFSCRTDGSDVQIHCGGGMDNPVELDFTDSGDMIGTVNILYHRPRVDCLVHWLYGGAYPHRERVLNEIKVTGELLGPTHRFGHVACSGLTRYRSAVMDHQFGDQFFATFFNSGDVVRLQLSRDGASYRASQHEFLSSTSREFHPTDVLEDADGSLLVIDTGGWFYRGCPTSQFAKPDALGGIYRIRRKGMTTMVDPWGTRIQWKDQTYKEMFRLLNDTRWTVRRQAINEMVRRGAPAIAAIEPMLFRGDVRVRKNCVLVLSQLLQADERNGRAIKALVQSLKDPLPSIRQLAYRGLGYSDASVEMSMLVAGLADDHASVRRQAAATLGMRRDAQAIESIIHALGRNNPAMDRAEEHALIFALMEIGDVDAIRNSMGSTTKVLSERVKRSGWIILDQLDSSVLTFAEVADGLGSNDQLTRDAASWAINRHPEWANDIAAYVNKWFDSPSSKVSSEVVEDLLIASLTNLDVASVAGRILNDSKSIDRQSMVLRAIASGPKRIPHESWLVPIKRRLASRDETVLFEAIRAARATSGRFFNEELQEIADDFGRPMSQRIAALSVIALQSRRLDSAMFDELMRLYRDSGSPVAIRGATEIIGASTLTEEQLIRIAPLLSHASPSDLKVFVTRFARRLDDPVARSFLDAIERADALATLSTSELSDAIKRFPDELLPRANRLLDKLHHQEKVKRKRLETLRDRLAAGDAGRGAQVFRSEKAKCSSCHQVGTIGTAVGPNLTTIGSNRSSVDLLESIVFPSASVVRDYESHKVLTDDGRIVTGVIISESSNAIVLQQANGKSEKLFHEDVQEIAPSVISIMPGGLDESLTEQELIDVVAYLQSCRSD